MNAFLSPAPSRRLTVILSLTVALLVGGIVGFFSGYWFGKNEEPTATALNLAPGSTPHRALPRQAPAEESPTVEEDESAGKVVEGRTAGTAGRPERSPQGVSAGQQSSFSFAPNPGTATSAGTVRTNGVVPLPTPAIVEVERSTSRELASLPVRAVRLLSDPKRDRIYASSGGNEVVVIDTAQKTIVKRILIGLSPVDLCIGAEGKKLFVANRYTSARAIGVIDLETLTRLEPLSAPAIPVAMTGDGAGRLFVLCAGDTQSVFMLRESDGSVLAKFKDLRFRRGGFLACARDGSRLFFGDQGEPEATVVSMAISDQALKLEQRRKNLPGKGTELVLANQDQTLGFATASSTNSVMSLIRAANLETPIGEIQTEGFLHTATFSPDDQTLFLASWQPAKIEGIDMSSLKSRLKLELGAEPRAMALDRSGELLFVALPQSIAVYSVAPERKTAASGRFPDR